MITANHVDSRLKRITLMGLVVTFGIVFGDIGTSPLYVMKAIVRVNPEAGAEYVLGAVSCIFWTLTIQTTIKYVLIALRADNHGEVAYWLCTRLSNAVKSVGYTLWPRSERLPLLPTV